MRSVPQGNYAERISSAGSQTQSRGGGIGCWTWPRVIQLEAHGKSDSVQKAKVKAAVCNRVLLSKQLSKRSKVAVTILKAACTARPHGLRRRCGVPAVNSVPVPRLCDRCSDCNINVEDVFATITLHALSLRTALRLSPTWFTNTP